MAERVVNLSTEPDFDLGEVTVRPSASEIVRDGVGVRVEPRVMQVLVALNRRRGGTVSREELIELCWSGASVSDDALVRPVSQLRKLLANGGNGNGGGSQIETIPKVGYRLVVAPSAPPSRSPWLAIGLAAGAVGGALLLTGALAGSDLSPTEPDGESVIARPLTSMPASSSGRRSPLLALSSLSSKRTGRATETHLKIHGFDWLPDGSGFIVSSNRGGEFALWRVVTNGAETDWTPLPGSGGGADEPRVSENGRLVFERWSGTTQMERVSLEGNGERERDRERLAPSTRYQWDARPSPNGKRIAFVSDRGGSAEIWTAEPDGGNAVAVTSFEGGYTHTPRFSPDGSSIAFATSAEGNSDLYIVDLASRSLERLTDDPGEDFAPAWSPDGRALYFGSTRSGTWQIWQIDLASRETELVTRGGGRVAQLSGDGATLYFVKASVSGLYRLDLRAGAESRIEERLFDELLPVDWNNWYVLDDAIFYVRRPVPDAPEIARYELATARYELATGRSETVHREPGLLYKSGIWVAKDESEIVLTRVSVNEADLMLLDRVRF